MIKFMLSSVSNYKEGFFGNTLGEIKEALDHYKSEGKISEDITMGIMVRRNPRTRPNDFALMSLKGFLDEEYGNSIAINSLDVANVMEGDYDFDKADFFFSHRNNSRHINFIKSS